MTTRLASGRLLLGSVVLVWAFALPAAVTAHAELVTATPAAGSTVTEPVSEVSATYSEDLTEDSRLGILDQDGVRIAVGFVDPANKRRMVATLDQAYVAGTFTVRSTAIADDGHVERTQWTFTIAVPATPTATPAGQSSAPPSAQPSTSPTESAPPTASPTPTASPAPGSTGSTGGDVILPIIAALAIITIGAGFLLSRGRRAGPA
ncbi:MAG TPA: copper resistance protein CopC [Candidatus Limnocylindrales bacterium]|nr:copper resistance protein CopC [Candidatus Limnocylindrales bacterium]